MIKEKVKKIIVGSQMEFVCKKAELSQKIILELQGSMIDLLNIWKLELVYYCIYAILAVNGFRALILRTLRLTSLC